MIAPAVQITFSYKCFTGADQKWNTSITVNHPEGGCTIMTGSGYYSLRKVKATIVKHFPEYEELELIKT